MCSAHPGNVPGHYFMTLVIMGDQWKHLPASDQSPHTGRAALKHRRTVSTHTPTQKNKTKTSGCRGRGVAVAAATHDGRHVAALVGGRHQRAQVGLAAHAGGGGGGALVLHALGHGAGRQQPRGGAVAAEAAVPWTQEQEEDDRRSTNRSKRCFVFCFFFVDATSGNTAIPRAAANEICPDLTFWDETSRNILYCTFGDEERRCALIVLVSLML